MKNSIAGLYLVISTIAAQQLDAANIFYFTSSPSAWVGDGETRTITPAQGYTFGGSKYGNQGAYTNAFRFIVSNVSTAPPTEYDGWELQLVGPGQTTATVGYYPNAERWPFQSPGRPGLNFSGNGRGNNTLTGEFRVLEVDYSGTAVQKFAVDFIQYDEGVASRWNRGSFRYNSDIPITIIPEPTSVLLALAACVLLASRRRTSAR